MMALNILHKLIQIKLDIQIGDCMGEEVSGITPKSKGFIGKVVLLFIILFVATPFQVDLRLTSYEVRAPLYFIRESGIDAPFPVRFYHVYPNMLLWMDWLMMVFLIILVGYYLGRISERNAKRVGWLSLGPGIVTFFVNLLSPLFGGGLILAIPIPLPAIAGLILLKLAPCELISPWLDNGMTSSTTTQ